jgi:hypothetical protein
LRKAGEKGCVGEVRQENAAGLSVVKAFQRRRMEVMRRAEEIYEQAAEEGQAMISRRP